jgi:hypothetical protein
MKQILAWMLCVFVVGPVLVTSNLAAQDPTVTMNLSQKVKLTLTGYDQVGGVLPPGATLSGWSVEGASKDNVLGTFEPASRLDGSIEPLSVWFFPVKTGTFRVQGGFVVRDPNGQLPPSPGTVRSTGFSAWVTVVVTATPDPEPLVVAQSPVPR